MQINREQIKSFMLLKWKQAVVVVMVHFITLSTFAQSVTPPPPTGGGGSGTGGGNPDGPLDPLIPFDSKMNMVFMLIGIAFALYVMIKRKQNDKAISSIKS
ncbi:MAG: hypothetical protein ACOYKE_07550 [Ferruginibacter sp.]